MWPWHVLQWLSLFWHNDLRYYPSNTDLHLYSVTIIAMTDDIWMHSETSTRGTYESNPKANSQEGSVIQVQKSPGNMKLGIKDQRPPPRLCQISVNLSRAITAVGLFSGRGFQQPFIKTHNGHCALVRPRFQVFSDSGKSGRSPSRTSRWRRYKWVWVGNGSRSVNICRSPSDLGQRCLEHKWQ